MRLFWICPLAGEKKAHIRHVRAFSVFFVRLEDHPRMDDGDDHLCEGMCRIILQLESETFVTRRESKSGNGQPDQGCDYWNSKIRLKNKPARCLAGLFFSWLLRFTFIGGVFDCASRFLDILAETLDGIACCK